MNKKTFKNVTLTCVLQDDGFNPEFCPTGILSVNAENGTFRFEEAAHTTRQARNLKLFDGRYVSMVRMQNGRYQCHLKTIDPGLDRERFAYCVYYEIVNALRFIETKA